MNSPVKPVGRTLAEFQPLKPAERTLLDACRQGVVADIASRRPDMATEFNTVRASLLRFLALGGDELAPVHEHGVELQGACIDGVLDLRGARVPVGLGLQHSYFTHAPDMRDSRIHGTLNLSGSVVPGLECDHAEIDGGLYLRDGFAARGAVRLLKTHIGGNLNCSTARIEGGGDALVCDRMVVDGSALLGQGFKALGKVRLLGAQIRGDLDCDGAMLDGPGGDVLLCDRMVVGRSVFFGNGFSANGRVRLLGAHIEGDLVCDGARLEGKEKGALQCDRLIVKNSVFLRQGFIAKGEVCISAMQIGGDLICDGAQIDGRGAAAVIGDRINVRGNVQLGSGFIANGKVRLDHARIGGNLSCTGADLHDMNGESLSCVNVTVDGTFYFCGLRGPVHGINLESMRSRALVDDDRAWGERLNLDGFVYGSLSAATSFDATARIAWLSKQSYASSRNTFKRQSWQQLIRVMRAAGAIEDARIVAIELERQLYRADQIGHCDDHSTGLRAQMHRMLSRLAHRIFGVLSGYGYRPLRVVGWMLAVGLMCAAVFWNAALNGALGPTDPQVFQNAEYRKCATEHVGNWYLCKSLPEEYPMLSPLAYSLDVMLPFSVLNQEAHWGVLIQAPRSVWHEELLAVLDLKHVTRLVVWFEILFGWATSLLLVAMACGITRRRDPSP